MWEKVNYIYAHLFHNDIKRLMESLSDEHLLKTNSKYRNNRAKSLAAMLRKGRVDKGKLREIFPRCAISKLTLNDQPLFDEAFFFESSFESFKKRVDLYVSYVQKNTVGMELSYRYIYMYDHSNYEEDIHNVNNLVYYEVQYAEDKNPKIEEGIPVTVIPPASKNALCTYSGTIRKRGNQLVLVFENREESVHMIFDISLATSSTNRLFDDNYYGLAIGADDEKRYIPVAKKVLFSKRRFSEEEQRQLYLILNETQVLKAREKIVLEQGGKIDADHIRNYQQKIKDIHTFFSNVKYSNTIDTSIMHHMVFTEFHVFQSMFEKFAREQDYFLHDRKRVYLECTRYLQSHPKERVYIVLPLYDAEENIFLYQAPGDKKTVLQLLIDLVRRGISLEMVFVIKRREDYRNEKMQNVFRELDKAGAKLGFVEQKQIEDSVGSYDFCYTDKGKDAVFKGRTSYRNRFTVTRNSERLKALKSDFQVIWQESTPYAQIAEGKEIIAIDDPVLQKLVGAWYLYFYGSFHDRSGEAVFWEVALEILPDYSVTENAEINRITSGRLEVFPKQSLFSLLSSQSNNILAGVVTNSKISSVMSVMLYSKQDQRELDMAMIGIMSRKRLMMKEEAQVLLGR
ncbi:MAG: hypothetical protein DSZ05_08880, partial [Sulfurospirillum sp.]